MRRTRRLRRCGPAAAVLAAALLLAGCTSNPVGETVTPAAPAPSSSAPVTPAPTPTTPPPTQVAADATPVAVRCGKLLPKAVARALVPELAPDAGWTPAEGTPAARLTALRGTACAWTDAAGDRLEVAVAKPSRTDAVALKNDLVRRSNSVPTYGGEAYFQITDHVGEVDAFRGRTWIVARSNRFFEPGDATDVMAAVDRALGLSRSSAPSTSPTPGATATPASTPAVTPSAPAPAPTATPTP